MALLFGHLGWEAVTADSGTAVRASIEATRPHLILMDFSIGEETCLDVLDLLGTGRDGIPVLVFSGNVHAQMRKECLDRGVAEVLQKPIGFAEIRTALARHGLA